LTWEKLLKKKTVNLRAVPLRRKGNKGYLSEQKGGDGKEITSKDFMVGI